MKRPKLNQIFCLSLLWLALAFIPSASALAQCSMCRANLSAAGARGVTAMKHGILVLLVPTVGLMAGIGVVIYRRRD